MSKSNYLIAFNPDDAMFDVAVNVTFERNEYMQLAPGQYVAFSNLNAQTILKKIMKNFGELEKHESDPWHLIVEPIEHIEADDVIRFLSGEG